MNAQSSKTLLDHAEAWWQERGNNVPDRGTEESDKMYEAWVNFAFIDFGNN